MKKVRLGIIGLGLRGTYNLEKILVNFEDLEINALCDPYKDRVEYAAKTVKDKCGNMPFCSCDYREVLNHDLVDAVYVASSWESHIEISIAAMRAGIITASEVGGAYTLEECFELVRAYEETGTPYMFMETCCFNEH